jgi:hypothetical protein
VSITSIQVVITSLPMTPNIHVMFFEGCFSALLR